MRNSCATNLAAVDFPLPILPQITTAVLIADYLRRFPTTAGFTAFRITQPLRSRFLYLNGRQRICLGDSHQSRESRGLTPFPK